MNARPYSRRSHQRAGRGAAGLVTAALILSGCAGDGSDGAEADGGNDTASEAGAEGSPTLRFSFANLTEEIPLFHDIKTNLDEVLAEDGAGLEVKWYDNAFDPDTMTQNARLMVQDDPDAIVMFPVSAATQGITQIFSESDAPCVSLNIRTEGCHFTNVDNEALGVETAEVIAREAEDRGWDASNTTLLIGQAAGAGEEVNGAVRHFASAYSELTGLEPVDAADITESSTRINDNVLVFDSLATLDGSFQATNNLLPSIPEDHNIVLYTINNDSTIGSIRAIDEAGRGDQLLIAGLGGDEAGVQGLREDDRWVAEGNIFIGWWGVFSAALAEAVVEGAEPPDLTPLPHVVLDKESVDEFHDPETAEITKLPPLHSDAEFLNETDVLQHARSVSGL